MHSEQNGTPMLIGLGGYAEAGKDAVADVLVEYGWFKTYMSKPLEKAMLILDPIIYINDDLWSKWCEYPGSPAYVEGWSNYVLYSDMHRVLGYAETKRCQGVRDFLQKLGTEVGRKMFGEDVWVDLVFDEIGGRPWKGWPHQVITGIRYRNELRVLRERGGLAVWVDRPGYGPVNAHSSDNTLTLEDFDLMLDNKGSLEDLRTLTLARFGIGD